VTLPDCRRVLRASAVVVLCAAALASAVPARAQFWPEITEKLKKGRVRLGPLALSPRIELRNAGVDTNAFLTPANPVRDTAVVLRASSDVYVPLGLRARVAGTGWLDFNYFASEDDPGSTDPGIQGRAEVDVWRLTLVGGGGAFDSRELYSSDLDERVPREERWVNGGVRLRLTPELRLEGGVESHTYRWIPGPDQDQTVRALLDRDAVVWKGLFRYRITPLTDLVASAEKIDDTFQYAPPGLELTTSYRYLAGFEFGERALINGRILGGVRDIPEGEAGSVPPYTGPALQASVTVPFLRRLRLTLAFDRDVYYSATGAVEETDIVRNTYVYGRGTAHLDVEAPLDFVVRLTGGYESADYERPYPVPGGEIDREDRVGLAGFSLLRRIGESALLGFTALHTRRESNYPGASYSRWQYGIQGFLAP
jgi:hypothetical protein